MEKWEGITFIQVEYHKQSLEGGIRMLRAWWRNLLYIIDHKLNLLVEC
jgi:hypothetical protein